MKLKTDLREQLTAKLPVYVFFLFVLQPVMDVLSYWIGELGWRNWPTLVLRFGLLALTVLLGFGLSHRKRAYLIAAGIMAAIGLGHIFAICQFGCQNIFTDLTNYVRCLQMPLTVLCLITFMRENEASYRAMKWGFAACLAIILLVQVLAIATGTEPHTYMDDRGYIGWFNNTNAQSAILTMVCPVAMAWIYQAKGLRSPWPWIAVLAGSTSMYFLGPRLSYLGLMAACFGLGVSIIIVRPADWKKSGVFFGTCLIFLAVMSKSPMYVHQQSYTSFQTERQGWIDNSVAGKLPSPIAPEDEETLSQEELEEREKTIVEVLTPVYETYTPDFVEIFGAERTMEMFDYTKDINVLTAARPKKLQFARLLMESSPVSARIFGLELSRFTVNGNIYDVENDLHGIYFLYGWTGLIAMLLFLAYFVGLIVWALFKDFRRYFTLDAAGWGIAFVMCLIHIYFTAGVLRRPNASFYFSAVLAAIYYLVRIRRYSGPAAARTPAEER